VTITRPFYLGVYEVTQSEYRQVMGDNPSHLRDSELLPVEAVSWFDAVRFCNKLSEKEGRRPRYRIEGETVSVVGGNGYRLPTEAEWEYACRASSEPGEALKHPFGNDDSALGDYAWFYCNSDRKTHPVGRKKPNRWGLYDMQGNVWEWCQDWYSEDYYARSPLVDASGPAKAPARVFRGGSWLDAPGYCRSASRGRYAPGYRSSRLGFRLAAASGAGIASPASS
jgi:formylglycine-generating enzyme required for sulfatase activity